MADSSYPTDRPYHKQDGSFVCPSGASIDIESGGSFEFAGTQITASAAELNQYALTVRITDIATAGSVWVVAPHAGTIAAIYTVIDGAITGADAAITAEIGGTLVTDSGITIANSGSAAGDVDSSTPSAANTLTAGQALEIITDGGSTNTVSANVTVLITR